MGFDFKTTDREALDKEFTRIAEESGDHRFFTKKEVRYLPELLGAEEQVLAFSSGFLEGTTWLIALTDRRIVFLDKGLLYGLKQTAIDLDRVNSISGETGIFFGKIVIADGSAQRTIDKVWKSSVKIFTNKVQEAIEARKKKRHAPPPPDPYDQLEKLAGLLERGVISASEFEKEKRKILG